MTKGTLRVRLNLPSHQLAKALPIEVRDASMAVVAPIRKNDSLELSPGLYQVSAVLDDGHSYSKIVEVEEGRNVDVELSPTPRDRAPGVKLPLSDGGAFFPVMRGFRTDSPKLLKVSEARHIETRGTEMLFVPNNGSPEHVPYAHLRMGHEDRVISLPVNPRGYDTETKACLLRFEEYNEGLEPRAWIYETRTVSSAMQCMVAEGQVFHAQSVATLTANDMLMEKYDDPVGAALGAHILFQAGTLEKREAWLENLARDFKWLPDGRVLLAALRLRDPGKKRKGIDLLLSAAEQRPLFTFSFSLLIDSLRLLSSEDGTHRVKHATQRLSRIAAYVDWSAFYFTIRGDKF